MAEPTSLANVLIAQIPVLTGAVIGAVSTLLVTSRQHKQSAKHSYKLERRNKLEELIITSCEVDVWIRKLENYLLFGGAEPLEQSPAARIEALSLLYFSELTTEVAELSSALSHYRMWLLGCACERLNSKPSSTSNDTRSKLNEFYKPVFEAHERLKEAAKRLMGGLRD